MASKSNVPAFIVNAVPTLLTKFAELPWRLKSPLPLIKIPSELKFSGKVSPIAIVPPLVPTNLIPPFISASCPKLIDACCDDIATSVASNSNCETSISTLSPEIFAADAVISPVDFKIKLSLELEIAVCVNPNDAIVPVPFTVKFPPIVVVPLISVLPSNLALEPVILPSSFTLKFEDEINICLSFGAPPTAGEPLMNIFALWKELESVVNPPIKPCDAVILPSNLAPLAKSTPSLSTEKFGPNLTWKLSGLSSSGVKSI